MKKQELIQVLQNNVRELEEQKNKTESAMAFVKFDVQVRLLANVIGFIAKNLDDEVSVDEVKEKSTKEKVVERKS